MRSTLSLLLLLALAIPALAQQPARERTCRILFLRAPSDAPQKLYLLAGATTQEVDLPRMNFSQPYVLPAGNLTCALLPNPPADPTDPAQIPAGAPSFKIPATLTDCYLLVGSDPDNAVAPVSIQVVDASVTKFKTGNILWFNLTPNAVAGQVGKQKLTLRPNSRLILDDPTSAKESYLVNLAYRIPDDERIHPLCETKWLHDPRSRKVAFIFQEKDRRAPRVLAFSDYRAPKKPEAE